jgi:hypothetical protein
LYLLPEQYSFLRFYIQIIKNLKIFVKSPQARFKAISLLFLPFFSTVTSASVACPQTPSPVMATVHLYNENISFTPANTNYLR